MRSPSTASATLFRPSRLVRALATLTACAGALLGAVPAQAAWNADTGVVLVGKVVTLNDAGDVLPHARVWLSGGTIKAIAREGEALPDEAKDAPVVDSKGVIYVGREKSPEPNKARYAQRTDSRRLADVIDNLKNERD